MGKRVEMQLKLSPRLKNFVERAVAFGLYSDAGACVEALIQRNAGPRTDKELIALLDEAVRDRRKAKVYTDADWDRLNEFASSVTAKPKTKALQRRRSA